MSNLYTLVLECLILFSLVSQSLQIMFYLQPNEQKCLREDIHKDVLVSGEYEIQQAHGQNVEIQVSFLK